MNTENAVVNPEVMPTKRGEMFNISPYNIVVEDDFNVRKDMGDLEGLMNSILANGQLEPIMVHKVAGEEKYVLTDGHRRFAAIKLALEKGNPIPYVKAIKVSGTTEDRLFAMVITGTDKKPLTVLEEAEAYKRLVNLSYEVKDIATRIGKSLPHVYNALKLADAPKKLKKAIESGAISATTVSQLIREVGETDDVLAIVETAIAAAKTQPDGKVKKVTKKDVVTVAKKTGKIKARSGMEKLEAVYESLKGQEATNFILLEDLLALMNDPDSTEAEIAKLFE
jgi:ParB/RepB/Spo0J family partition protein